jgi:hypothetical protein
MVAVVLAQVWTVDVPQTDGLRRCAPLDRLLEIEERHWVSHSETVGYAAVIMTGPVTPIRVSLPVH